MNAQRSKDWFWPWALGAGVVLIVGGIGLYFLRGSETPSLDPVAVKPPVAEPIAQEEPAAPVSTQPPERSLPLPKLNESDAEVVGGLTELLGQDAIMQFLVPERLIRNVVVTIDNAPRQQLALSQRPIKQTPSAFITAGADETLTLSPQNYARYAPFIAIVRRLDTKTLVSLYRGLQPLFQQAYEELGHPNSVFHTRLLEVIRHLIATPDAPLEVKLVQPSVQYKYADERLEKLSAGQKVLIRMGRDNATVVKAKLRELEAALK
ncbi:MAG: DUF3014 domain-containing protein [Gammaproteobacteria bacterium]